CYPKEHFGLYMDIQNRGAVISEQPPGEKPYASYFPARNRIISGLSDIVLVIEAKEKSGSLITADMALEQGKDIYALPGPVTSPLSQGCHRLISQGAGILISPQELLKNMNLLNGKAVTEFVENKKVLESPENMVYSCLDLFPKGIHTLIAETGMQPEQVIWELISLQLEGKIKEISKNYYVRVR
ncbi:MAG: DNA-processing protein DprA, partial [Dorea sp.]